MTVNSNGFERQILPPLERVKYDHVHGETVGLSSRGSDPRTTSPMSNRSTLSMVYQITCR